MAYRQLTTEERYTIAALRSQNLSTDAIAKHLGRHRSTIYREVSRNATPYDGAYRPSQAKEKSSARKTRSRRNTKFENTLPQWIADQVRHQLSPQQIVGLARSKHTPVMSHESIYRRIRIDRLDGGVLYKHLRGAWKRKRKRYRGADSRGRLGGKKMISERPAIVDTRSRIGDWEIDTVHGCDKASIVTIVERKSGLVLIGKVKRATAELVLNVTIQLLEPYRPWIKTITADNGSEFHMYKQLEAALGIPVYFANPHQAWQRGTNENTNGLIRQYLPKGMSLRTVTQDYCDKIAGGLNDRPRKRHNFLTPNEVMELYTMAA